MDRERRIPPFPEDALVVLNETVGTIDVDSADGFPKSDAKALLADDDRFTETDPEYALDVLQNRGYLYYVDDRVQITPTND
jgi:hypothetical protein